MYTASDFAGHWSLRREIVDRHGQMGGTLIGQAAFEGSGQSLVYKESGQLTLQSGSVLHAERRYLWKFTGQSVNICFADGRPFHTFVPLGHAEGSTHLCGTDTYCCTYNFCGWPAWTATWHVIGPNKDYTSVSRYENLG